VSKSSISLILVDWDNVVVQQLATVWTVRGSNLLGLILCTRPDRP